MNIPHELLEKLTAPKVQEELKHDMPDMPEQAGNLIMMMGMPEKGKQPEKDWPYQTDWICYNDAGDVLCVTCISDDGKAWFIKQFTNTVKKGEELKKMVTKGYHEMLQDAKRTECDNYHYYICECQQHDKLKSNKALEKMLPEDKLEGEHMFKDYEVPINFDDFKKELKQYYKVLFENPGKSEIGY